VEAGTAWCLPLLPLILPANTERLLVGISAGIGTNRRQKLADIQLVMVLSGCRPGAPS
jgi:hypothetical protein